MYELVDMEKVRESYLFECIYPVEAVNIVERIDKLTNCRFIPFLSDIKIVLAFDNIFNGKFNYLVVKKTNAFGCLDCYYVIFTYKHFQMLKLEVLEYCKNDYYHRVEESNKLFYKISLIKVSKYSFSIISSIIDNKG